MNESLQRLIIIIAIIAAAAFGLRYWGQTPTSSNNAPSSNTSTNSGGDKYSAKVSGKVQVQTTPTGLQYVVHQKGMGPKPTRGQAVTVHYTGWLWKGTQPNGMPIKGKKFDSSRDRGKKGLSFPIGVGRVIRGWDEGVMMMSKGARYTLIIPAKLGYGARGAGRDIPPNAKLVFDVEVLKIQ
ncbi:MAG TPA: peptidylprolyl isomerase [Myxococcales bacterium]|nr:peptidylprolyl isomerase [Deltaproteobacteria bacterium]MBU53837.1 peptidylprolyl isomerase [Deltaproteobacteria bacterium]HAA57451.1 peptidylprolyl isomerase [Myxococcales bacterium]|tara:strand:+ start:7892 stop:8437 length:546 start_codon:yes stop_codon:yes gene_type:complete